MVANNNGCFLCSPDPDLVYESDQDGVALCGLGPLVRGYSLVATRRHIRSAADALGEVPEFLSFASKIRSALALRFGSCLMTEHGRVPACVDVSGTTDPHCFHAHFLLFPGAPPTEERAREHFKTAEEAGTLAQAMQLASAHEEYFLFSLTPERFVILTRPGKLARQFARFLVADALGDGSLANWRGSPRPDQAKSDAAELRGFISRKG